MKRACLQQNTNTYEKNHASSIRPLKINFVRMKRITILLASLLGIIFGCTHEPADLEGFNVVADNTDIIAGSSVTFTIEGNADFVTFYSGQPGSVYANYPNDKGEVVDLRASRTKVRKYNRQGQFTATFVAASSGNWGEDYKTIVKDFVINVTDNRTGISSFSLFTGGLLNQIEYKGVINAESRTIVVNVPAGTNITSLKTSLLTESPDAIVKVNGDTFVNNSRLNYSNPVVFHITAPNNDTADWTVTVNVG